MTSPVDSTNVVTVKVCRVAKDRRPAAAYSAPYPGATVRKRDSSGREAMRNLVWVWKGTPSPSRFSDGSWNVLYTAKQKATALAEVGHHLLKVFSASTSPGTTDIFPHILYEMNVVGRQRDFGGCSLDHPYLCSINESGYPHCWRLAEAARNDNIDFLKVPSARRKKGICHPVFTDSAASKPNWTKSVKIEIYGSNNHVLVHEGRSVKRYHIVR